MPYKLTGKIQHYAWGGYDFIPRLLHRHNPGHEPFAEYWLGAHDKAPSTLSYDGGKEAALNDLIRQKPEQFLGKITQARFGRLPFLFKVLDVRDMLSIQVHPTKEEAEKGFARENAAGIPLDAPHRNYKDDNHKPEMMVALSEFYLLHGFRERNSLLDILNNVPEFSSLYTYFNRKGYEALYTHVMNMPRFRVNEILRPLLNRLLPLYKKGRLSKTHPDFWAARAADTGLSPLENPDKGIFSVYFFNLAKLLPGQGIFQAAGVPHAYLEGQNVELMANSDNVLRGGLTPKHVDTEELLKHIRFEGISPRILPGDALRENEWSYPCRVSDFTLNKISLNKGEKIDNHSGTIEILLLISGRGNFSSSVSMEAGQGDSILILPGERYTISAGDDMLIYKAFVPVQEM